MKKILFFLGVVIATLCVSSCGTFEIADYPYGGYYYYGGYYTRPLPPPPPPRHHHGPQEHCPY